MERSRENQEWRVQRRSTIHTKLRLLPAKTMGLKVENQELRLHVEQLSMRVEKLETIVNHFLLPGGMGGG